MVELTISEMFAMELREIRDGTAGKVIVMREPVGVVGAIIPWNVPFIGVLAKSVPALLTGCPIVVKPPPEAPLSSYLMADAAIAADMPSGVLNIVAGGPAVGEHLVGHPGVDKISFTGSAAVGVKVAISCGANLKGVTLELGGKSAAIVLPDADLERHTNTLVASALPNTGQVCHATTRILVPRERSKELVERLTTAVGAAKLGDPHDPDTVFGPLTTPQLRERVERYIDAGRDEGATVVYGGKRPPHLRTGWFVEPTIFTNVRNSMKIAQEEIFGPLLCIIDYDTEDEAVEIANDSVYGLGGAIFTSDIDHGVEVASRIQTGTCRINEAPAGGGGGPFGGVKRSGLGRERSREGLESFLELKSVALPPDYTPATHVPPN
jgi:betaine-aldehyde dehydrogenase